MLGLLTALGCSAGSTGSVPEPQVTTVVQSASASATVPFTTEPGSATPTASAAAAGSKDFGYFAGTVGREPLRLSFDRAQFLTGDAADKAAAAHGQETPVPNDYVIVNDNPKLRVLTVAETCVVYGSLQLTSFVDPDHSSVEPRRERLTDLVRFLGTATGRSTPWHLTYGTGGVVKRIDEQYVP